MNLELPQNAGDRLSQVLPTVKCSFCGKPVALSDLSDHVCDSLPPPSPSTPRPAAILAKIRQASLSISRPCLPRLASLSNDSQRTGSPSPRLQTPVGNQAELPHPGHPPSTPPPPPPSVTATPVSRPRVLSIVHTQTPVQLGSLLPPQQIPLPASPILPPTPVSARFDTSPRSSTSQAHSQVAFPSRTGTPSTPRPRLDSTTPSLRSSSHSSGSSLGGPTFTRDRVPSTSELPPTRTANPPTNIKPNFNTLPILRSSSSVQQLIMDRSASVSPSLLGSRNVRTDAALPILSAVPDRLAANIDRPPFSPIVPVGRPVGSANEVNMAGVGRRGFQAAVQAAMATRYLGKMVHASDRMRTPTPGMDGRRSNIPTQLSISANPQIMSSTSLSPNASTSSHSPRSPSPRSPHTPEAVSSSNVLRTPSPASTPRISSTFSQRFNKNELEISTKALPVDSVPPPSSSDSEYSGIAYDRRTESGSSPASPISSGTIVSNNTPEVNDKVLYLTSLTSPKQHTADIPIRSASSAASYSYASRHASKSTSALDREFNALLEETLSPSLSTAPLSPQTRSPKLPTRSRTAPTLPTSKAESSSARSRPRQCTRCNKVVEDGRWLRDENSRVLCEMCWKVMYLPKCRDCNLPIERHVVSSADGQLKGKYHRECFNCFKCQQPFPDKEFYVFDGQPYCRYHYHEANASLCSDPDCGQPIEGACAVTHSGDRYHPEHLLCDFREPDSNKRCHERLEEYWEVNGRMLCELHVEIICGTRPRRSDLLMPNPFDGEAYDDDGTNRASLVNSDMEFYARAAMRGFTESHNPLRSSMDVRAMRRRTQFIDLR